MIYSAPYVMLLMQADTLRWQVGEGWVLEIKTFLGPVKWQKLNRNQQETVTVTYIKERSGTGT